MNKTCKKTSILLICTMAFNIAYAGEDKNEPGKPNIVLIAVDDLNDWIGCMGVGRFKANA